ncbi:MAG: histidine phosphatase family protein [Clostridia bacterium]|nr:histidine phosphatase family protein [Clostridia bacterium]
MRILFIRHGDPDYERDTLTEKGHREAKLLAEKLKQEKIDYIYCSPLGRAKHTCQYTAKALGMEKDVVIKDWLQEFDTPFTLPTGEWRPHVWDMRPSFWTKNEKMYDQKGWSDHGFFANANVAESYQTLTNAFDELLGKHGYVRDGRIYRAERANTDTVAFFCHFGLEGMLLSHLCNLSPIVFTHHFVALPSSVTTLYSEEREKGIVTFRCCALGDTSHLYAGNEPISFAARFCEIYDSNDRHE